jgi:hypothetical protein
MAAKRTRSAPAAITTEATRFLRDADDGTRTTLVTRLDDYAGTTVPACDRDTRHLRHGKTRPRNDVLEVTRRSR